MLEQDTNSVFELSTGLSIDTVATTQKEIKKELEVFLKEKDIRAAISKNNKTDINNSIIEITYPTFEESFSSERQDEIVTNFAIKHKMTEDVALVYIKNAIATEGEKVISKLKECY